MRRGIRASLGLTNRRPRKLVCMKDGRMSKPDSSPITKPADFDGRGWGPHTWPMFAAAREGRVDEVRRLLAAHPWLARAEYASLEPLHYAVNGGHVEVVKAL